MITSPTYRSANVKRVPEIDSRRTAGDADASTRARCRRLPHIAAGNFGSAGEALAVDVRRERFWGNAAEPTHVNGFDLAFGEQLVQKASSDP